MHAHQNVESSLFSIAEIVEVFNPAAAAGKADLTGRHLCHKRLKRFRLFPVLNCDGSVGVFANLVRVREDLAEKLVTPMTCRPMPSAEG